MKSWRIRFGNWMSAIAAVAVALALVGYIGSYVYLSRRGLAEAPTLRLHGFLYVPIADGFEEENLAIHLERARFFALAHWVDRALTGVNQPVGCFLRLQGPPIP